MSALMPHEVTGGREYLEEEREGGAWKGEERESWKGGEPLEKKSLNFKSECVISSSFMHTVMLNLPISLYNPIS